MDDEVTQSQEGVQDGDLRPYAHRDVKPGELTGSIAQPWNKANMVQVTS
jgi:hypothetical protein